MTDSVASPEGGLTKDSLVMPGTPAWNEHIKQPEEAASEAEPAEEQEEAAEEVLAEAQDDEEQVAEETPEHEGVFERRTIGDFAKQAGITQEEFYRDIYRMENGKEVSVSQAFDERKALQEANDALLRERAELKEKVTQASTQASTQRISPEAEALMREAELKVLAIQQTDWSTWDEGKAANTKLDLQLQAQTLARQAEQKQAEHNEKLQQEWHRAVQEADREVRSRIPEWNDEKTYRQDWQGIRDMAATYGITAAEIDQVHDYRWRQLFRDALQAKAKEARISKGVKTVRKIGRTAKAAMPSNSRGHPQPKPTLEDARNALSEARKRGASLEEINALRLRIPLGQ